MVVIILLPIITIIILGDNHPYSQLRTELLRTRLQRVREAGMQGRLALPSTSTHYDHEAQQKIESVWFFSRGRKTGSSGKPSWHSRELTHNSTHYGPLIGTSHIIREPDLNQVYSRFRSLVWNPERVRNKARANCQNNCGAKLACWTEPWALRWVSFITSLFTFSYLLH